MPFALHNPLFAGLHEKFLQYLPPKTRRKSFSRRRKKKRTCKAGPFLSLLYFIYLEPLKTTGSKNFFRMAYRRIKPVFCVWFF
jgi:hypothetical protein